MTNNKKPKNQPPHLLNENKMMLMHLKVASFVSSAQVPTTRPRTASRVTQRGWLTKHGDYAVKYSDFSVTRLSTFIRVPGKWFQVTDVSISLLPKQIKNKALPTIKVSIDEQKCMVLMNSGCLQTLVGNHVCQFWWQREAKVLIADEKTLKCWGHDRMKLNISHAQPVHIDAMIVNSQLLGFDLLGINTIR